jgi:hypothetical protein
MLLWDQSSSCAHSSHLAWLLPCWLISSCCACVHPAARIAPACRFGQQSGELVTPGLVQLAVQLAGGAVDSPLQLVLGSSAGAASVRGLASPSLRGVLFSLQLLQAVFKEQKEARAEILKTCQVCVVCVWCVWGGGGGRGSGRDG